MKKTILCLLFLPFIAFGQRFYDEASERSYYTTMDLVFTNTRLLDRDFFGFNMDYKVFYKEKVAMGISLNVATRGVSDDFTFEGVRSEVTSFDVGWINHYDFVQTKNFRLGVNLTAGYSGMFLNDRNEMEEVWTEFGVERRPKTIARSGFFNIQPGFESAVKIAETRRPDIYLIFKAKYRQLNGATKFGHLEDFSGMFYGFGIMLSGF